jgi:hypothetical protein
VRNRQCLAETELQIQLSSQSLFPFRKFEISIETGCKKPGGCEPASLRFSKEVQPLDRNADRTIMGSDGGRFWLCLGSCIAIPERQCSSKSRHRTVTHLRVDQQRGDQSDFARGTLGMLSGEFNYIGRPEIDIYDPSEKVSRYAITCALYSSYQCNLTSAITV